MEHFTEWKLLIVNLRELIYIMGKKRFVQSVGRYYSNGVLIVLTTR